MLNFLFQRFVAGAVSGMLAAILTTPFDVIKTRRQVQIQSCEKSGEKRPKIADSCQNCLFFSGFFSGFLFVGVRT